MAVLIVLKRSAVFLFSLNNSLLLGDVCGWVGVTVWAVGKGMQRKVPS